MMNFKQKGQVLVVIDQSGMVFEMDHKDDVIKTADEFIRGYDAQEFMRVLRIWADKTSDGKLTGVQDVTEEIKDALLRSIDDVIEYDETMGCPPIFDEVWWQEIVDEEKQDRDDWKRGPEYYYGVPARL